MKIAQRAPILVVAMAATASPAAAQPVEITVPGGVGVFEPSLAPRPIYNDDYVVGPRLDPTQPFDPADAAINAVNVSGFYPPPDFTAFNFGRAATLNATGESIAEMQIRCQNQHPTYDPVSNTYFGPDGLPVRCR